MTMTEHTTPQPSAAEAEYEALVDPEFITVPRRLPLSLRIVRTTVLDELRADVAQADKDVKAYEAIADTWAEAYETEARLANEAEKRADDAERVANEIADTLETVSRDRRELRAAGRDLTDILSNGDARIEDAIREIAGVLIRHAAAFDIDPDLVRRGEAQLAVIGQTDRAPDEAREERDEADRLLRAAYRYPHESTSPALIADHLSGCEQCAAALREIPDEDLLTVREFAVFDQSARANQLICAEARRRQPTFSTLVTVLAQMQHEDTATAGARA
ncbi:hypothetical protein [Streptomyces violascens]|uniref:hypothetical protein n=1 Tax=Streptomyces violascens TaxID=67381 RepID=UPI001674B0CA|nr:hypothetical protein [Streptomyces violascens]GGU49779.1 hypothetical protein GCM10010289_82810 [Streptomyces violascens]